jgi:branched-chain amino acid transport system ATP-binding protein
MNMNKKNSQRNFVLKINDLRLDFGGVRALSSVDVTVGEREILAIIGPNGAGKTCLLNCISGFYRPQAGSIYFQGQDITPLPAHKVAKLGIARTFQNIELYSAMSVVDNLMAARHLHYKIPWLADFLYFGWTRKEEVKHRAVVEEIIDLLEMQKIRKSIVGMLPEGQRKRVELGRALALEPRLLLLDEPMAGMNVEEKEDMARFILDTFELKEIPVVMVEHDMGVVMDIADRIYVLDFGVLIAEGTPEEIKNDAKVIKAYLGE